MLCTKILLVVLSHICLLAQTLALNIENNACKVLIDYHAAAVSPRCYHNPDVLSDVPAMAKNRGFGVETHSVTTSDGYILNIFHIIKSDSNTKEASKPVFIQHGITTNSGVWVDINNRSLAFILVNSGYDVWLGNVRGSTYSNKHVNMTVDNPNYWEFNLDIIAGEDIPQQLKYVFNKTGTKCIYIGHSMGTTLAFMYTSEYSQEASGLIEKVIALAPVVYLDGVVAIELIKPVGLVLVDVLSLLHVKGLLYQEKIIHTFLVNFCKFLPELCVLLIDVVFGPTTQFQSEDLLLYYSYWPSGTSIYQLKQYLQIADSKRFQKYDYGSSENLKRYGTSEPPAYNLSSVTLPVCLFYGENDSLYTAKNLERLYNELNNTQRSKYAVPLNSSSEKFDHIDFEYPSQKYTYSGWLFNCLESKDGQST